MVAFLSIQYTDHYMLDSLLQKSLSTLENFLDRAEGGFQVRKMTNTLSTGGRRR